MKDSTPKLFLVITSKRSQKGNEWEKREQYVREFYGGLDAMIHGLKTMYTTYDDIECVVADGTVTIRDIVHDIDLADVGLVHFKNWMFNHELAATIAFYLEQHKVEFFNSEVNAGLAWGKISQMIRLASAGVRVPDSFFTIRQRLISLIEHDELPSFLRYPLIIKDDQGSKGNDNFLVYDKPAALAALAGVDEDKDFVMQNFLPNDGDYRFLFIGLDEPPLVFMRKAAGDTHLNNTSQGGSGSFVPLSSLPAEHLRMARRAAEVMHREISGVDILVDKTTGTPYVLEVNSTPALATGYGVATKQQVFASFLRSNIEEKEEE